MKILLLLTIIQLIPGVRCDQIEVTGFSGGNVLVDSGKPWSGGYTMFKSSSSWNIINPYQFHDQLISEKKSTLFHNEQKKLMIFIRDLKEQDTGMYRIYSHNTYTYKIEIVLNLKVLCCTESKNVTVKTGETSSFSCGFSFRLASDAKVLWRKEKDFLRSLVDSTVLQKQERFSLSDDVNHHVATVKILNVTVEDAGDYYCGDQKVQTQRTSYSVLSTVHLHVLNICCQETETRSVYISRTVSFSCTYSNKQQFDSKILFKEENQTIKELIPTAEDKRVRISEGYLTVTVRISNLREDDAGVVYYCAVQQTPSYYSVHSFRLHVLKKRGLTEVTSSSGDHFMIKCEHLQHRTSPKYLCKEPDGCSEKIPAIQDQWKDSEDVSVYDNTAAGVLTVVFKELNAGDAGTYRCGVMVSPFYEIFSNIQLQVKKDSSRVQRKTQHFFNGEDVKIICKNPEEHEAISGHLCKEDENHICQSISTSAGGGESSLEVFFSTVSVRDAGIYWCGTETRYKFITLVTLSTAIHLHMIMPPVLGREEESADIVCPYDPVQQGKSKTVCKGPCPSRTSPKDRLILNKNDTNIFTATISSLRAEDAGKYWCALNESNMNFLSTDLIVIMKDELTLTRHEGEDLSIQCESLCKASDPRKCVNLIPENGISPVDDAVNLTVLRTEDTGTYWCGTINLTKVNLQVQKDSSGMMIITSVSVTLLMFGALILLLFYILKYIKTRGPHLTDRSQKKISAAADVSGHYANVGAVRHLRTIENDVVYAVIKHAERGETIWLPRKFLISIILRVGHKDNTHLMMMMMMKKIIVLEK